MTSAPARASAHRCVCSLSCSPGSLVVHHQGGHHAEGSAGEGHSLLLHGSGIQRRHRRVGEGQPLPGGVADVPVPKGDTEAGLSAGQGLRVKAAQGGSADADLLFRGDGLRAVEGEGNLLFVFAAVDAGGHDLAAEVDHYLLSTVDHAGRCLNEGAVEGHVCIR